VIVLLAMCLSTRAQLWHIHYSKNRRS